MSTIADSYATPIFDQLKEETPELELPALVGLTYEECVEHAANTTQPKGEEDDSTQAEGA